MNGIKSILVICVGNICRSPIAEGLLKAKIPETNIASAGLSALVGNPADRFASEVCLERDIDISSHIAQQVNRELLQQFDLILTMESSHQRLIIERHPFLRGRVLMITQGIDSVPVMDPYRKPKKIFEVTFNLLNSAADQWALQLNNRATVL